MSSACPPEVATRPVTRRDVLKAVPAALLGATLGGVFGTRALGAALEEASAPVAFDYGSSEYPIIFEGETIRAFAPIDSVEFFLPLFGRRRALVNPVRPTIEARRLLRFAVPGEYYLRFDGGRAYLKVLVLSRQEPASGAMRRLFDFCVANMLYSGAHDDRWNLWATRDAVIPNWFQSCEPLLVSCAPTHAIFRQIVEERFAFPTRVASFTGTHLRGRRIVNMGHNVPEVYLPDLERWVMFDVNHGYFVRWMDALGIAMILNRKWGDRIRDNETWRQLGIDLHTDVQSRPMHPTQYPREVSAAGPRVAFSPRLVADYPLTDGDRTMALRAIYGGPVYWGQTATALHPVGTEFLPGNGVWACTHRSRRLRRATMKALANYIPVPELKPAEVQKLLDDGHRDIIAQALWRDRVPELGS